jgi:Restriction endonuclease AspBHI N-terminal
MIFTPDVVQGQDLHVGAIYEGTASLADEPIHKLLGVANIGGIRPRNNTSGDTAFVVLYSTSVELEWPDALDYRTGVVTYFGDNRKTEMSLHDTSGNKLIRKIFSMNFGLPESRRSCPPFLLFSSAPNMAPRSVRFDGLAVPGAPLPESEWCVAKYFVGEGGKYQNYEIKLTVLAEPLIRQSWIEDRILERIPSTASPRWFDEWGTSGRVIPLTYR